ncbi:MAG TPA: hypothetical protein VLK82_05280 [Candidatus Tectomicrobia bacterium]|nr:hypothetical protein [Candidatus Tectomicrobia bacterium]
MKAPAGVTVMVLCDAYYLGHTVVQACREKHFRLVSTLKSHRSLFKQGWKLKAGRDGQKLLRRRRTETLVTPKPHGHARSRSRDAGWLEVSTLGPLHVVFSRTGQARTILGRVTDAPDLSVADVIRTYETRWTIAQWVKDLKQLLGLGQYQNRPYRAAVTHLHLVCFAYALLPHLRLARSGAQGQGKRDKAADRSTATAQDQLRRLVWDDLVPSLQEQPQDELVLAELERLRVA